MRNRRSRLLILRCVIAVLLLGHLCLIFHYSNEPAVQSDRTSTSFIGSLLQTLDPSFDSLPEATKQSRVQSLQKVVRTLAHMAEFALLGVLVCAFVLTFSTRLRWLLCGLGFCAACGASDEIHQLFVPGRTFQWEDILVDTAGAAAGMTAFFLVCLLFRYVLKRKKEREKI